MQEKKNSQLGIHFSTACARLRKKVLFELVKLCGLDVCFRCGKLIANIENLSIDHKVDWMDSENPVDLFYDGNNIIFSHLGCNIGASVKPKKYRSKAEKSVARRKRTAAYMRKVYTKQRRRDKYQKTGY